MVDKDSFIYALITYETSSILINVLFIVNSILMVKLIDITALKKYIQESNITIIHTTYIIILYILLYFEYYFIFGEYDNIIRSYINFFAIALPIIALIHTFIKLSSYKIASELNEQIEVYNHEKNRFF